MARNAAAERVICRRADPGSGGAAENLGWTHGRRLDPGKQNRYVRDADRSRLKPRPVVRYNSGFSHKAVRGKNYRMVGAIMVTTADRGSSLVRSRSLSDAARSANGAIIHYFLEDKPSRHLDDFSQSRRAGDPHVFES